MAKSKTEFGKRLKELRTAAGLTQMELAIKAGINAGLVARIEQGGGDPTWLTALRLAQALGVSLDEFRTESGDKPKRRRKD